MRACIRLYIVGSVLWYVPALGRGGAQVRRAQPISAGGQRTGPRSARSRAAHREKKGRRHLGR
ncbi:hypothetical protein BDY21DRAFT_330474 [Lineolata rhizophorae]|uniref:Uncharacterized protein n=1 Tax=Lineolata rhizophorae TaxID=578093 RepID=A0A6A6PFG2_9PEZI|nr:hypothetical protein BDY21DRAFT_330474 [Lineolata rhizophorae]